MHNYKKNLLFFLFSLVTPLAYAQGPEIQWLDIILPPYHHIESMPSQNEGITDKITQLLQNKLPEIKHTRSFVNINRLLYEMKKGSHVCNPSLKKTKERDAFIYYSFRVFLFLPMALHPEKKNIHCQQAKNAHYKKY